MRYSSNPVEELEHLPEAWRVEMRRGLRRLRAGEYARAEAHFARAHRWAPDRPEVLGALGRERLRQGDVTEAARLLEAAWRADPSLISVAGAWARCLGVHLGRPDDARAVLDEAAARDDSLLLLVRAEIEVEAGRAEAARTAAEQALAAAADPGERSAAAAALARAHNLAGIELCAAGEVEAALFLFKRAADADPLWSGPHVNLGAAFARLDRRDRAIASYRRALELDADNPTAHQGLALLLRATGDGSGAERHLRRVIDLRPRDREALRALADLLARDGRYLEAAVFAERAMAGDEGEP
jgi:tetratricopeptide (TPR) repeat protein